MQATLPPIVIVGIVMILSGLLMMTLLPGLLTGQQDEGTVVPDKDAEEQKKRIRLILIAIGAFDALLGAALAAYGILT